MKIDSIVTTHHVWAANFCWIIKNWQWSPEYITNEQKNVETSITSPIFESEGGLQWQMAMAFVKREPKQATNGTEIVFKCFSLVKPTFDPRVDCLEVKGTFRICRNSWRSISEYKIHAPFSESQILKSKSERISLFSNDLHIMANLNIGGWSGTHTFDDEEESEDSGGISKFMARASRPPPPLSLISHNMEFADLTITIDDQDIPAHKAVLAARSPVLRAMLSADMKEKRESRIVLMDVSAAAWRLFQNFLYTNVFQHEGVDIVLLSELLMLSDKYEVKIFRDDVETAILNSMNEENLFEIVEALEKFDVSFLYETATEIINKNWETLKMKESFKTWLIGGSRFANYLFQKLYL